MWGEEAKPLKHKNDAYEEVGPPNIPVGRTKVSREFDSFRTHFLCEKRKKKKEGSLTSG